jgi:tRNA pseudouridine32 synthase/23S rRNA pseudouridine746 synthase
LSSLPPLFACEIAPEERVIPALFPSPFDELGPCRLARGAAQWLEAELPAGRINAELGTAVLQGPEGGKMFGVLIVETSTGELGVLRGFSGKLGGRWDVAGFVPPPFDAKVRDEVEPAGDAVVKALLAREEALERSEAFRGLRAERDALASRHAQEERQLRALHESRRAQRHALRAQLLATAQPPAAALDQESREDRAQRRERKALREAQWREVEDRLRPLERRLAAMQRLRRVVCRELFLQILATYELSNARGERRRVPQLFAIAPPGGAGDCAAPKLLQAAYASNLRPVALAEFWWGAPPNKCRRVEGP